MKPQKSWLAMAMTLSFFASACGPVAPSISKALLNQGSRDSGSTGLFSVDPVIDASTDESGYVIAESTLFVSHEASSSESISGIQNKSNFKVEISDNSDLSALRDGDDTVEIAISNGGFPEITSSSKVHVVVELSRPVSRIPEASLLPNARVSLVESEDDDVQSQIVRVKFLPITDPTTSDSRESLLRDVKRIYIYNVD